MPIVLYFLGSVVVISGLAWIATVLGAANTAVTPVAMMLLAGAAAAASLAARASRRRKAPKGYRNSKATEPLAKISAW